ncbi:transposase, partial [Streptomyces sp. NPDC005096]|uniref:transposase n=1 Tax=Streptomyces sp. NPDC005096 TaxID=3154559 RepID=UPI0033AA6200
STCAMTKPPRSHHPRRPPYLPPLDRSTASDVYLDQRWQEGCTNAWEEIREQGYPRGYASVRAYASRTLRGKPQPVGPRPPSARAVTRWILTHPDALPESDRLQLKAVLANRPELTALAEHVHSFGHMVAHLQGDQLPTWIEAAASTTELPSLRSFAQHLERDLDAVTAGLTLHWNSGVVEGHVNRIKMLKRQMFGRAGFELLCRRVLLA